VGGDVLLPIGRGYRKAFLCPDSLFFIVGSQNTYFGAFSGPFEYLLLHCNRFRSRPSVGLYLQSDIPADCAWLSSKTALNTIFPGGEYATNLIVGDVKKLSHDDSNVMQQFKLFFERSLVGEHGPLAPSGSAHRILL